jgi:flagellin
MSFSVNTNSGAMAALQSPTATSKALNTVQGRINTGLNVASTKDTSAAYTTAQSYRSDGGGLVSVSSSLSRAKSVTDIAVAGVEQIDDIVNQMSAKAYQAADAGIDAASRTGIDKDFEALKAQITTIVDSSSFNVTNLLKTLGGSGSTHTPVSLTIANQGLDLGGSVVTLPSSATDNIDTQVKARTMVATLKTTSDNLHTVLIDLGAGSRRIDSQSAFARM